MRLKKRLLAFSRRLHARIRKTRYMHKMRCLLINRRSLLLALRLLWKTPIFPSNSRFPRLCAKCLLKLKRLVSILPMTYFFSSRRRHTMYIGDWSSDVCSSDLRLAMNTMKKEAEKLPEDVELLLPWHAAGTLSRRDAARVEQALANDNELAARYDMVREELGEAIRLNETLGAPSARAMQTLFAKIDAEPARKPRASFNIGVWLTDFVTGFQPRTLAYGATAAALAIVLQAGILAGVFVKEGSVGFTSASLTTNEPASYVAVRFNPQASAAGITKFLADNKATIVGGPASGGMFKLRVSDSSLSEAELSAVVKTMSASPVIGLAAKAN